MLYGRSKAKYVFSIHLNSITEPNSESGVEIYVAPRMELTFAKAFVSNIMKYANTNCSTLEATYNVANGVYARTFKEEDAEESINEAIRARARTL